MKTYTKLILRPDWDAKRLCENKLQAISEASNLEMYISAPDGHLSVLVDCSGTQQILIQAQNYHELLDMLTAVKVYIAIMKMTH